MVGILSRDRSLGRNPQSEHSSDAKRRNSAGWPVLVSRQSRAKHGKYGWAMLPCGLHYGQGSIAWLGWVIRRPPRCTLLHVMIATGLETVGPPAKFFPIWRRDETMANKLARFAQHY